MTWKEKSVSYVERDEKVIESSLGDVIIDWRGIRREVEDVEEWEDIRREMDDEEIMEGFVAWDEVEEIVKKDEFLSYPHVDIVLKETGDNGIIHRKKKIFFREKEEGEGDVKTCFKSAIKYWYGYRQRNSLHPLSYSYDTGEKAEHVSPDEEVDIDELGDYNLPTEREVPSQEPEPEEQVDEAEKSVEELPEEGESSDVSEGEKKSGTEVTGLEDILELAERDPEELMRRFGNSVK